MLFRSIDIPLMADPRKKGKTIPSANGKESLTKLKVIERYRIATLVECRLITGRHHQIRVHCAAIGHPLLIDEMYGSATEFKLSSIKRKFNLKKEEIEKPLMTRVTMHSLSLTFVHPTSRQQVSFKSEYPKDFRALTQCLRKYAKLPDYYKMSFEV